MSGYRRGRAPLIAVAIIGALATAGCTATTHSAGTSSGTAKLPAGDVAVPATDPAGAPPLPTRDNHAIVYIGELDVQVHAVDSAAAKAISVVREAKGFVSGDHRESSGHTATATLVFRIPAAAFTPTVDALGATLGKELSRQIKTDDVTEAVVDLDSRITSQQASVRRTRMLFDKATRIADIVTVEQELAKREADLASLVARKRQLADQVTLSTVTLNLATDPLPPSRPAPPRRGFFAGLSAGWHAFTTSTVVLLTVLGALLPFAFTAGVIAGIAVLLWRRRRRLVSFVRRRAPSA